MSIKSSSSVFPGQLLGSTKEYEEGPGTYARDGQIRASLCGSQCVLESPAGARPRLSVISTKAAAGPQGKVPEIGSIVLGQVTRIQSKAASVAIQIIDGVPCREPFSGLLRVQDVRSMDRDSVIMHRCFRPGDLVRAQIISLGDSKSWYLSTAENELGVVFATSPAGEALIDLHMFNCSEESSIVFGTI
jgi:exosome complex component CSL4